MQQSIFNVTVKEAAKILFETVCTPGHTDLGWVVQRTAPDLLKKDRETKMPRTFQRVVKESSCPVILNSIYEKAVLNLLMKEGKDTDIYQAGENYMPLEYGPNNIFIGLYKGEPVLQYRPNDKSIVRPKTTYFVDGKETAKDLIKGYLPKDKLPTNQGTDRPVFWRKVYLRNVVELTLDHKKYILLDGGQAV